MPETVSIQFATTQEEREAVFRQRYRVYAQEMGVYRNSADHQQKLLQDGFDASGRLLYASLDGEVAASLRIHMGADGPLPEPYQIVYDLERFAAQVPAEGIGIVTRYVVDPQHRGSAASFRLMVGCCDLLLQQRVQLVFLACSPHLINLYLAMGFRTYTRNFNDSDVGIVVPMVLLGNDLDHLRRIKSPLWSRLSRHAEGAGAAGSGAPVPSLDSTVTSEHLQPGEFWAQVHALLTEQSHGRRHIFDGLNEEQTHILLDKGHLIECSFGELIIKKGSRSSGMYIIMSGVAEACDDDGRVLSTMGHGEVFGEIAFLLESPRAANVRAASDRVQILSTDERTLRQIVEASPATAAKFLLNLSRALCLRLISLQARSSVSEEESFAPPVSATICNPESTHHP
jgi:CRP-like cAMP-binding protein/predicted GNAT family N-acyltransferase